MGGPRCTGEQECQALVALAEGMPVGTTEYSCEMQTNRHPQCNVLYTEVYTKPMSFLCEIVVYGVCMLLLSNESIWLTGWGPRDENRASRQSHAH